MKKSFKFRIYPIKKQEERLEKALDQSCFLYNQLLDIHQQIYLGEDRTMSEYDMNRLLKDFRLKQVCSQVKYNISKRISDAFKHFFRRVKSGETPGFPKFHKRIFYSSITFPQYMSNIKDNKLKLPRIGNVDITEHRNLEGKVKTLTIKKVNNEWYAIFSCDGVPVEKVENNFKSRIKLANQYMKVRRQREDFHKKLARKLTKEIKYIGVENLNIQGMVRNHCLAKSISDAGWGQFLDYLKYYKTIFDGEIVEIGRFEPTSKLCSKCNHKQKMPLSKRTFKCKSCGLKLDRDYNASINIKKLTIKKLVDERIKSNTVGQTGIYVFGDTVRPTFEFTQEKAIVEESGNYREIVC